MTTSSSETGSLLNAHGIYKVFGIFGIVLLFNYQCSLALFSQAALIFYHTLNRLSSTFLFYFFQELFVLCRLSDSFDSLSYLEVFVKHFFLSFFQELLLLPVSRRQLVYIIILVGICQHLFSIFLHFFTGSYLIS